MSVSRIVATYLSTAVWFSEGTGCHYLYEAAGRHEEAFMAELAVDEVLASMGDVRKRAQRIGALSLIPFIAMLVVHAVYNDVPLFLASFAGFLAALPAIARIPNVRALAMREARLEYAEYYFLFPLFLSITLLTSAGFFDVMQTLVANGIVVLGQAHVAFVQFLGSTFLSAILDNNIVADFASRGLHGLETRVVHFFAMAQIAGYALVREARTVGGNHPQNESASTVWARIEQLEREVEITTKRMGAMQAESTICAHRRTAFPVIPRSIRANGRH
jgi:hypothetical protein